MIPITSATTLSIEKTATLLQKLLDLRNEQNVELSGFISSRVDKLVKEQQQFVEDIDEYLQIRPHFANESEIETITTIVETCPEFLATQEKGRLPCFKAAEASLSVNTKYLLSFAQLGLKHGIGGKGSRGGLLIEDDKGTRALKKVRDPDVFDVLQKHNPPLFYKEDIKIYTYSYCSKVFLS